MKVSFLLITAVSFFPIVAGHLSCGNHAPPADYMEEQRKQAARKERNPSVGADLCVGCITLDLYFHVIKDVAQTNTASIVVTDELLADRLEDLAADFSATPFKFNFRETTVTLNDDWASADVRRSLDVAATINAAVRRGGADTINIIISDGVCLSAGGFATYPYRRGLFPTGTYDKNDFIFVCSSAAQLSDSSTFAHEIG